MQGLGLLLVLAIGLIWNRGYAVGEPRPGHETREALFAAFREAVRNLDPEAILELCDEDTIRLGLVFVSDLDPAKIPEYAAIPGFPEYIDRQRAGHRYTVLEKIPPELKGPEERLLAALEIRMLNSGEEFCRGFEGYIGDTEPLFEIPGLDGYEVFTLEDLHACEGVRRAFPVVQKEGQWYIGYLGAMVFGSMMDQTLERMAP